jgi:hypothetical protein
VELKDGTGAVQAYFVDAVLKHEAHSNAAHAIVVRDMTTTMRKVVMLDELGGACVSSAIPNQPPVTATQLEQVLNGPVKAVVLESSKQGAKGNFTVPK